MRGRVWMLLLVCLPMLSGLRDPFQPPQSNCPSAKTGEWRYSGIVAGNMALGLVRGKDGRWLRVRTGDRLPEGWRVLALNEKEIIIDTFAACEPRHWRWQREGTTKNENRDIRAVTDLLSTADR